MSCKCKEGKIDIDAGNIVIDIGGDDPTREFSRVICLFCEREGKESGFIKDNKAYVLEDSHRFWDREKTNMRASLIISEYGYVKELLKNEGLEPGNDTFMEYIIMKFIIYSYSNYIAEFIEYKFGDVRRAIVRYCLDKKNQVEPSEKNIKEIKSSLKGFEAPDEIFDILLLRKNHNWVENEGMRKYSQGEYGPLGISFYLVSRFVWYDKPEEKRFISEKIFNQDKKKIVAKILHLQKEKTFKLYNIVLRQYYDHPEYFQKIKNGQSLELIQIFNPTITNENGGNLVWTQAIYKFLQQVTLDIEKNMESSIWGTGFYVKFKGILTDDFIQKGDINAGNYEKLLKKYKEELNQVIQTIE